MKTTRNLLRASAVVLAVLMAGCATPESRIRENPQAFARLTPPQQALVRAGQVAPGFDMDAVRLALGDPDHVMVVTSASGRRQIWRYLAYGDDEGALVFDGYYNGFTVLGAPALWVTQSPSMRYPGYDRFGNWVGPYPGAPPFVYATVPSRPRDRIRVFFDATGHVALVRQAKT